MDAVSVRGSANLDPVWLAILFGGVFGVCFYTAARLVSTRDRQPRFATAGGRRAVLAAIAGGALVAILTFELGR